MSKEDIDTIICQILSADVPDEHADENDIIPDFVVSLRKGRAHYWKLGYEVKNAAVLEYLGVEIIEEEND